MTGDNRMPNFWWCPTHHLYRGGDKRPCADAVRLVPEAAGGTELVSEDPRIREIRAVIDRRGSEQHLYLSALPIEQRLPDLFGALRAVLDEVETWANAEISQEECARLILHAIATAFEDPDSRVLFGRTLPACVATVWHPEWTELVCRHPHERGSGPWKALVYHTGTRLELDHLDRFLARHSHCVDRARAEREEALRGDRHAEITEAEASEARDG